MDNSRKRKVAQTLGKELGIIMRDMFKKHGKGIVFTLQECTITKDLSVLRAYYTFLGDLSKSDMDNLLEQNNQVIRRKLSAKIKDEFRAMPEIRFIYDKATEEQEKINALLKRM
ncbi:MAG: ribosome-binding factor A [Bacteroidota bacterium]|nr:ribosome-binding factor A [Bacteroidota bacterium]